MPFRNFFHFFSKKSCMRNSVYCNILPPNGDEMGCEKSLCPLDKGLFEGIYLHRH